jgi:ATP-dependent helicase HrpA
MEGAGEVARVVADSLRRANAIEDQLKSGFAAQYPDVAADIRKQMSHLLGPAFMQSTPMEWLKQIPRYLRAIEYRIEKIQGNVDKEAASIGVLEQYWRQYEQAGQTPALIRFRWMLEEFRVSLFAQPLGTRIPVSAKRIDKEWQKATKS